MNYDQHVKFTMGLFIIGETALIMLYLTRYIEIPVYYYKDVILAGIWMITVYFLGCSMPDWDHDVVLDKWICLPIRWLKKITSHRGHWHSIFAMLVYGLVIWSATWLLAVPYAFWIAVAGMVGFFSHLVGDDIVRINLIRRFLGMNKLKHKPRRAIKLFGKLPFSKYSI